MENLAKISAFLLVNIFGFLSVVICFYIGLYSGALSSQDPDFNAAAFKNYFIAGTMITWAICALFSVAYFFVKGRMRLVFLWMPLVAPMAYGLYCVF